MQTFLPYADFMESARCLDYKRLGKQRVEAWQIYQIVSGARTTGGWINHPATKMWRSHPNFLAWYYNAMLDEWEGRGYKNTMKRITAPPSTSQPLWFGDKRLHDSHRSNLLRKNFGFYSQYHWDVEPTLAYYWPET